MKKYQNTYELYRGVFDEVHAPRELLRKVESMSNLKSVTKMNVMKKTALAAVAAAALFVASNAVVYASTGSTWVEQIVVHVTHNDNVEDVNMTKTVDDNGNTTYEMQMNGEDGEKQAFGLVVEGDDPIQDGDSIEIQDIGSQAVLTQEDGKIYFELPSMDIKQDITEDFADGKAEFAATDAEGHQLTVTVEGTIDQFSVSCSSN